MYSVSGGMHYCCFLDGGEWLASCLSSFTAVERRLRTLWIGGRIGPRADMDAVKKRKSFDPSRIWVLMEDSKSGYSRKNVYMFVELHKATISFIMSVCLFVCPQLSYHRKEFREIWKLTMFPKSVMKIQVWLKSAKCNRYYVNLWYVAQFLLEWEMIQTKVAQKMKTHTLHSITFLKNCAVYEKTWKNPAEPAQPQMTI